MSHNKSYHSLCRWTFNAGKGGFVPGDMRPGWNQENLDTVGTLYLIKEQILPRLPDTIEIGFEMHYDSEVNEETAGSVADALIETGIHVAMVTPGAHSRYAYGGVASLDAEERKSAEAFGQRTVDLAYGPLRKAWHPEQDMFPTLIIWNGSYGYDLASVGIRKMYQNLKESVAGLCQYEADQGGDMYIAIEPKPNEGHPTMLLPTVASTIIFWRRLEEEFQISRKKKGVNKEFGHSEMIGLDHVYDTVEEIDNDMLVHAHLNSQGYNDGIILGGPGKYDIDHGTRINGMNIAIARLFQECSFRRWKGHDMQVRAYDNEEQGIGRVVRSILSWEACDRAAQEMDMNLLMQCLEERETAQAEDIIRSAVVQAQQIFDELYKS